MRSKFAWTVFAIFNLSCAFVQGQESAGYEYGVPDNPLNPPRPTQPPPPETDNARQASPSSGGHSHGHDSDDPLAWLRDSVPGEPDVDYPILNEVPETSFTCDGKSDGMYADVEARCQPWHQCYGDRKWSFLCPNGTIFNQEIFTCVWWFDFDCNTAESFYNLNDNLYEASEGSQSQGQNTPSPSRPSGGSRPNNGGSRPNNGGSRPNNGGSRPSNSGSRPSPPSPPRPSQPAPAPVPVRPSAPAPSRPQPPQPPRPTPSPSRPQPTQPAPTPPRPQPTQTRPQPTPSRPQPTQTRPQPTPSRPQPTQSESFPPQVAPVISEESPDEGYLYPVPPEDQQLNPVRPSSTIEIEAPLPIYGAPPAGRGGRSRSEGQVIGRRRTGPRRSNRRQQQILLQQ